MRFFLVCVVVALLGCFAFAEVPNCPKVFDGLTNGHFDLSTQFSTNTMSANWVGLSKDDILTYECAIVSSKVLKSEKLTEGCRQHQGFLGIPDVKNWVNVRKESSIIINNLNLVPETTYYVVLRTTLKNGIQVFSNTNGIVVLPQELNLEGSHKTRSEDNVSKISESKQQIKRHNHDEECAIDAENRCRAGQVSVREFLNQFYGPPRYAQDDPVFLLFGVLPVPVAANDDDDDDNTAENHGIIAGVIAGALLLCLICLLLLALLSLLMTKNGGDEPFNERIIEKKQEHVDADIGSSTEHQIASDTRVEFPDIDPHSRLSQA